MYYKIYYIKDGYQGSLPNRYEESERKIAEKIVEELNKNRDKKDPYYWLQPMHEVIRVD